MKRLLLATTLLALPLAARAQPVTGLYVGAGAGASFMQNEKSKLTTVGIFGGTQQQANGNLKSAFNTGYTLVGSIGYGFGNGIRLEAEGNYRESSLKSGTTNAVYTVTGGNQKIYGGMVNALFDFDIGSPWVWPYIGVGAGYAEVNRSGQGPTVGGAGSAVILPSSLVTVDTGGFAYQGIAGASFPIPWVVGLSATLEYRFFGNTAIEKTAAFASPVVGSTSRKIQPDLDHSVMLGLRYAFYVPPPPAPPAPVPAPAAPAPARSYLVFFDWDRADLTDRARQIIAEAAQNVAHVQHTTIEVDGHADRTGTAQYNVALSQRRADVVAAELVRLGVARSEIQIHAFGDTKPLVPTAAGVREPQNRRVEIVVR